MILTGAILHDEWPTFTFNTLGKFYCLYTYILTYFTCN